MGEVQLKFEINDIYLGDKLDEDPKKDVHQYLVIDVFEVKFAESVQATVPYPSHGKVYIIPKATHIHEYPIRYCVDCLGRGKRNKVVYITCSGRNDEEAWSRCKDHYGKFMRKQDPTNACPKCSDGYMQEAGVEGEIRRCTHCSHWVPVPGRVSPLLLPNSVGVQNPVGSTLMDRSGWIPQEKYDEIVKLVPLPAVNGIIIVGGSVLLLHRKNEPGKGLWWVPGGKVKFGESILQALSRELKEETGLDIKQAKLASVDSSAWKGHHTVEINFLVTVKEPIHVKLDDESDDWKWFKPDDPTLHPLLQAQLKYFSGDDVLYYNEADNIIIVTGPVT